MSVNSLDTKDRLRVLLALALNKPNDIGPRPSVMDMACFHNQVLRDQDDHLRILEHMLRCRSCYREYRAVVQFDISHIR